MRNILSLFFIFSFLLLNAQEDIPDLSPVEIQKQLDDAEKQFQQAKGMFNPWYAGPLLTGGAHMMPVGAIGLQPYVFATDNYALYSRHRHANSISDLVQFNAQFGLQTGLTSWMDLFVNLQGTGNWQNGRSGGGFGDTNITLGFKLLSEGVWVPALKFTLGETLPTGPYQNLSPSSGVLAGTGAGSFQTSIGFHIAKLVLWDTQHPLNLRATFTYNIPSLVRVRNFNSYGGGFNTNGTVHPGNQFNASVGLEWSFTQKWVFANDFVYVTNKKTKFTGTPGTTSSGSAAPIGAPSSDQFSLAPAIEYNPTPNLGFLAGFWFSVTGRNSLAFLSGVVTVSYTYMADY